MTDEEILKLLKHDLRAAHRRDLRIDMSQIGVERGDDDTWVADACGVCAAGAALLGQKVVTEDETLAFARLVGRSRGWANGFMYGSDGQARTFDTIRSFGTRITTHFRSGFELGQEIYAWVQAQKETGKL